MAQGTRALVVRDSRTMMHELVRPLDPSLLDKGRNALPARQFNELMMAKKPSMLVAATDAIGPLRLFREDMQGGKTSLLLDAKAVTGFLGDGTFLPVDAERLMDECVLDPFLRIGENGTFEWDGRRPIADARRVARLHGPMQAHEILGDALDSDDALFEIEPLQDWVLARNLISIVARLGGLSRLGFTRESILERAGFAEVRRTTLVSRLRLATPRAWVLPLTYNAYFREGNVVANDLSYPSRLIHPLLDDITETVTRYLGLQRATLLRGAPQVALLSAAGANLIEGAPIARDRRPEEEHWLYLTLQGDDQHALAKALVSGLNALLGLGICDPTGYDADSYPVTYENAVTAAWATCLSHPQHYLMCCKQCGRTVLSNGRGPAKEFCDDGCRSTFNRSVRPPFLR